MPRLTKSAAGQALSRRNGNLPVLQKERKLSAAAMMTAGNIKEFFL